MNLNPQRIGRAITYGNTKIDFTFANRCGFDVDGGRCETSGAVFKLLELFCHFFGAAFLVFFWVVGTEVHRVYSVGNGFAIFTHCRRAFN